MAELGGDDVKDSSDMEEEVKDEFRKAADFLPQIIAKHSVSDDDLLYLYARFKHVTSGPCNTTRPGLFEFQAKKKWDAWNSLKKVSKEDAKSQYIQKIKQLDPSWQGANASSDSNKSTGKSWVCVSTMPADQDLVPNDQKNVYDWCQQGDVANVEKLLKKLKTDINALNEHGLSLLHYACDRGHADIVRLLIKYKANVNITDIDGQTPLHYGCSCGHVDIVKILIDNKANLNITDNDGETAADVADDPAVQHLLSSLVDQNATIAVS